MEINVVCLKNKRIMIDMKQGLIISSVLASFTAIYKSLRNFFKIDPRYMILDF